MPTSISCGYCSGKGFLPSNPGPPCPHCRGMQIIQVPNSDDIRWNIINKLSMACGPVKPGGSVDQLVNAFAAVLHDTLVDFSHATAAGCFARPPYMPVGAQPVNVSAKVAVNAQPRTSGGIDMDYGPVAGWLPGNVGQLRMCKDDSVVYVWTNLHAWTPLPSSSCGPITMPVDPMKFIAQEMQIDPRDHFMQDVPKEAEKPAVDLKRPDAEWYFGDKK